MSTKYRLIKEYPDSPKLGTMGEIINRTVMYTETDNDIPYYSTKYIDFKKYPEYWEEIVEKDYEILTLARFCSIKPTITNVSDYKDGFTEALLKCDNARIHSVKRKSDGEIFTVGDNIIVGSNNKRKLHSFFLNGDKMLVCDNISINNARWSLSNIRKNTLLFTTEDGVDIFENCEVYQINDNFTISCYTSWKNYYGDNGIPKPGYKWFSTKEAAEEYINSRKPYLSNKDVLDEIEKCTNIQQLKKVFTNKVAY